MAGLLKMKESVVTSQVRLIAAQNNIELWRNNCGGFYDQTGRFVRYGLGSFSSKQECKSSDFIGITPVFIMPEHVGRVLGVFTAVEMKASNWEFNTNDKHCLHQKNFIDIVKKAGGNASLILISESRQAGISQ